MIAWTRVNQGELGQESHFERALSLFEELGDVKRQGDVLTYFGAMAYWEGRWREAVELYERGGERSQRAGDVVGAAIASRERRRDPLGPGAARRGRAAGPRGPSRVPRRSLHGADRGRLQRPRPARVAGAPARRGRELLEEARRGRPIRRSAPRDRRDRVPRRGHGAARRPRCCPGSSRSRRGSREAPRRTGDLRAAARARHGCAFLLRSELDQAEEAFERSLAAARAAGSEFEVC